MGRALVHIVALTVLVGIGGDALAKSHRAGALRFELDFKRHSRKAFLKKDYYRRKLGCNVVSAYHNKRAFLVRAIRYANAVLRNPDFARMLGKKRYWAKTRHRSKRITADLLRKPFTVYVTTFRRDRQHPCRSRLADGHTNAFVPDVRRGRGSPSRLLFISYDYLAKQYQAPSPIRGVRNLAKTLIHEALHARGYSHAGLKAFGKAYNNTVPVYIGCLVMNWSRRSGRLRWAEKNCHLATKARRSRSLYRWTCHSPRTVARYKNRILRASLGPAASRGKRNARFGRVRVLNVYKSKHVRVQWTRTKRIETIDICRLTLRR
jgi:hypothetical protein